MSVRVKLFGAMALLVFFMGLAYLLSTQLFLRHNLPALVAIAEQTQQGEAEATAPSLESKLERISQLQDKIYNGMIHVAFKVVGGLSIISLLIGLGLVRLLTLPLRRLTKAISGIGQGDLSITLPVTTEDEYGKVAEAMNRMTANLARSEEVRKHMVADIAHELRTPLTILQGRLELIQQNGSSVSPESLLPMQDEVIRLGRLVSDLHQLSMAEAGTLPLDKQSVNLLELLSRMEEWLAFEADERGVKLIVSSSASGTVIPADKHRITQVFQNLISNALRHTPAGGQVSVRLAENEKGYVISISDTGEGIPSEHLPFLFDRFYRVQDDRSRHSGGMGLGLAIAKQFTEAHGGHIEVDSRIGSGTTFSIHFPQK